MDELLTYEEVLKNTETAKRYLLLGNGFSMSYNVERFSFTSLLDSAVLKGLIKQDSPVFKIFSEFNTKDFEEVIKLLETSVKIIKEYCKLNICDEEKILGDAEQLKKHLVSIITNNHPEKITDVSNEEFFSAANFLKEYEAVYTLNYDLLLYWTTVKIIDFIKDKKIENERLSIQDGFYDPSDGQNEYVTYANDSAIKQFIYYLHGALHIFDMNDKIIKNTYVRTNKTLTEQTLENLNKNIYPIFVSEGTSEQKKAKIIHNAYLNHCYKSFSKVGSKGSSLVVFGTLLKRNDNHIREAILNNKINNIYFGVGSEIEKNTLESFAAELTKEKKNVYFYNYKTAKVWR